MMSNQSLIVDHPLLTRLSELDREIRIRYPDGHDPGLGCLGLILNKELDDSRYDFCTPTNARTFACTGGNGVHFSLLIQNNRIDEHSPVVVTNPAAGGFNDVVGENLQDFLGLGMHRGYFALEHLSYNRDLTIEVFTNPDWQPSTKSHYSIGFVPNEDNKRILAFLAAELNLKSWSDPARFAMLNDRFGPILEVDEDLLN